MAILEGGGPCLSLGRVSDLASPRAGECWGLPGLCAGRSGRREREDPVETGQLLEEVREGVHSSCWVVPEKTQETLVNWKFRETASNFLKY